MSFKAEIKNMTFYATKDDEDKNALKVFLKLKIPPKGEWKNIKFPLKPEEDHGFFSGLEIV